MKSTILWTWLVLLWLASINAPAQDYYDDDEYYDDTPQSAAQEVPPAGFWPTEVMIDLFIDRATDEMARVYGFDDEQLDMTRAVVKERFPAWMQENRADLQQLGNEWIESLLAGEPPNAAQVADWAQRALPYVDQVRGLVEDTADDMRLYLTDEQQVILDGEMAAMNVAMGYMEDRMQVWSEGGFDWRTEWPRSEEYRQQEKVRVAAVNEQADEARDDAMGRAAENITMAGDAEMIAEPERRREQPVPTARRVAQPEDEWARYVAAFIKRYNLNEGQRNSAMRLLKTAQEQRDMHLARALPKIERIQRQLAQATSADERARLQSCYETLKRPVEKRFQQLKDKLDAIPTRKQRVAAARTTLQETALEATPDKGANSAKRESPSSP